ncbi:MAG: hypothetical protein JRN67_02415 [Nitrososphaerota archaeon]|nr:hypothetical protein [Nitrososphaerota archaeon]
MAEYKAILAAHRVDDLKAADKAMPPQMKAGGHAGLFIPRNFETQINGLAKDGWRVVFSNSTSYLADGVILYALLSKD